MADYDAIIIGAGAAGLAASQTLIRRGYRVALVEARDRIGGRVYTIRPPSTVLPIELGADFIHGRPREPFELADGSGLRLYEQTGNRWVSRGGRLLGEDGEGGEDEDETDDEDSGEREGDPGAIFAAIRDWRGSEDRSLLDLLNERFVGERWAAARASIRGYAEGFDAAEVEQVSVAWLRQTELASDAVDGDRQFRVLDGYDRLMEALGGAEPSLVDLRLHTVARELLWQRGHVTLSLASPDGVALGQITARAALITVPLGVLKRSFDDPDAPGALRMTPDPPGKREALSYLAMGHAIKVVLHFSHIFWDALPHEIVPGGQLVSLPQLSFLFSDDPVMPTWWTYHPLIAPVLTGWVGGPKAVQLADASDEAIIDGAVSALARVLGVPRAKLDGKRLVGRYVHNWSGDPFSRGAYSYVRVGGLDAPAALAEPVQGTLFFAGEASDTEGETGTVHAALHSGYRAGGEIARALADQS
jgi:monoamine oxidase